MNRPSYQFYPSDWDGNPKLKRCSFGAQGAWIRIMNTLHKSDDGYGICKWPLKELAKVASVPLNYCKELVKKDVLKGNDLGRIIFKYTPRHAGKDGDPVMLINSDGPLWFCSRFVRDEWVRCRRGGDTKFTKLDGHHPSPKAIPKGGIGDGFGTHFGDGASSSTSLLTTPPIRNSGSSKLTTTASEYLDKKDIMIKMAHIKIEQSTKKGRKNHNFDGLVAILEQDLRDDPEKINSWKIKINEYENEKKELAENERVRQEAQRQEDAESVNLLEIKAENKRILSLFDSLCGEDKQRIRGEAYNKAERSMPAGFKPFGAQVEWEIIKIMKSRTLSEVEALLPKKLMAGEFEEVDRICEKLAGGDTDEEMMIISSAVEAALDEGWIWGCEDQFVDSVFCSHEFVRN